MVELNMEKGKLKIWSDSNYLEIQVFDHRLQEVVNTFGSLDFDLPVGIYKVQTSSGSSVESDLIEIKADETIELEKKLEKFQGNESIIPIGNKPDVRQLAAIAKRKSKAMVKLRGDQDTGQLFIFVSSTKPWNEAISMNNHIELHASSDLGGVNLRGFSEILKGDTPETSNKFWGNGETAVLEEGNYRLQIKSGGFVSEQSVYISKDVQTQIFLTIRDDKFIDVRSICFAQVRYQPEYVFSEHFKPEMYQKQYQECILAKDILMDQVNYELSDDSAEEMAHDKFAMPILGIYAAHHLIRSHQRRDKASFVETIFRNTSSLLGEHPDVMSIGIWLNMQGIEGYAQFAEYVLPAPPMLRSSWDILLERSNQGESEIPVDPFTAIAANYMISNPPWFSWEYNEVLHDFDNMAAQNLSYQEEEEEDLLPKIYAKLIEQPEINNVISEDHLSSLEAKIVRLLDDKLPTKFLDLLYDLLTERYDSYNEDDLNEQISQLIRFMTEDIYRLLEKTLQYLDGNKREVVELILQRYENEGITFFESSLKDFDKINVEQFEVSNESDSKPVDDLISSKDLSKQMDVTTQSIHIAFDGLKKKLKL